MRTKWLVSASAALMAGLGLAVTLLYVLFAVGFGRAMSSSPALEGR